MYCKNLVGRNSFDNKSLINYAYSRFIKIIQLTKIKFTVYYNFQEMNMICNTYLFD